MDYLLLKWIHIISATIVFGTGLGSAYFMFMANRGKDVAAICFVTKQVVIADWLFTTPAVIIQLLTGLSLVHSLGMSLFENWVLWALILYVFAGCCWIPVVWIQIKMRDMAFLAFKTGKALPDEYWKMNSWWVALGSLAFPAVLIVFYLMVYKPSF